MGSERTTLQPKDFQSVVTQTEDTPPPVDACRRPT